jgi:ribosomal protein L32
MLALIVVYECPDCGERLLGERRCPECNLFCKSLGRGGRCPCCEEAVAVEELGG